MKTIKTLITCIFLITFSACHLNYNKSVKNNRVVKSSNNSNVELSCTVIETKTKKNLNKTSVTELLIDFKTPEIVISEKINSELLSDIFPKLNGSNLRIDSVAYTIPATFSPAEIHLHFNLPPDRIELSFPVIGNSGKWALDKEIFTLKIFELQN
jgi:hypothetical protein